MANAHTTLAPMPAAISVSRSPGVAISLVMMGANAVVEIFKDNCCDRSLALVNDRFDLIGDRSRPAHL